VVAFFQLIHSLLAVSDGGVAVLDAGGKKELKAHEQEALKGKWMESKPLIPSWGWPVAEAAAPAQQR
jgi:hypothetical protein